MAHVHTSWQGRAYDAHNVPKRARLHGHIAQFFHFEGERVFPPQAKGSEIADELSRNLRPRARRTLFERGTDGN